MDKPNPLPPTLRPTVRYIVFQVISENKIKYDDINIAAWGGMLSFLGEFGSSDVKLWFLKELYDEGRQMCVVKCRHDYVEQVRAVLSLVQIVGETRATLHILGVTG